MSTDVVLIHPDSVNVADLKAMAATFGAEVVLARSVPQGQAFFVPKSATDLAVPPGPIRTNG